MTFLKVIIKLHVVVMPISILVRISDLERSLSESDSPRFHHRPCQTQRCALKVSATTVSKKKTKMAGVGRGRRGCIFSFVKKTKRYVQGGCFGKNIFHAIPGTSLHADVSVTKSPTTTLGALYTLHVVDYACRQICLDTEWSTASTLLLTPQ